MKNIYYRRVQKIWNCQDPVNREQDFLAQYRHDQRQIQQNLKYHFSDIEVKSEIFTHYQRKQNRIFIDLELYQNALAINPQHVYSLWGKGDCLRMIDQFEQALEWYEKALAINPQHVYSLWGKGLWNQIILLAFTLFKLREFDDAYHIFKLAKQMLPNQEFIDAFLEQFTNI
ncbi:unnamed protein product [Paramecium primaurelia]|uniref:Tetratricopeptide repeat protein n=1 Tax=Paramecium primaurelia TaxID=5886 RepID=A0A8S1NQ28_PARPR|nr:unnamed protein product [Paramecium primaurelia]